MKKNYKKIIIGLILPVIILALFFSRTKIKALWFEIQKEPVPQAQSFTEIKNENINSPSPEMERGSGGEDSVEILDSVNLAIPFQSQAPNGDWGHPYQEACEEASIILSINYLRGATSLTKDQMNEKILDLVDWQMQNWGGHYDLTAEKTVELIKGFYGNEFQTEIIYNFSWDDVKKALSQGYPVIAPTAGRLLGNPYYTAPGPLYHMLVIKGYTSKVFITNDVGTRRGANYQYSYDTLYNGIHDWNDGDVNNGQKVIIVIKPAP
jgi:hypothetical protein